ncbi:Uma2 family endonuclease [Methylopila sp. M107]|uniref:Uma2 family endonuclease n=1 Tax=Methylopila sp. M107 TaxID=1101190 RepID=UPI00035E74D4|nr:Uma2 family endonuclease [Methylopila sp. M107]
MDAPAALAEGLPRRRFTVADVFRMVEVGLISEDERLEVLDGEIVPMSPKGSRHEDIKVAIAERWRASAPADVTIAGETGLRLSERTYLEPDFIVFSRAVRRQDVKGPDILLTVEVADSSFDYDLKRKSAIYASFGVSEFWVVDAARREVHVHLKPGSEGYGGVRKHGASERLTPVFAPAELAFSLEDLPEV